MTASDCHNAENFIEAVSSDIENLTSSWKKLPQDQSFQVNKSAIYFFMNQDVLVLTKAVKESATVM